MNAVAKPGVHQPTTSINAQGRSIVEAEPTPLPVDSFENLLRDFATGDQHPSQNEPRPARHSDLRALLLGPSDGSIAPFHFKCTTGSVIAPNAGLSGFLEGQRQFEALYGKSASYDLLGDYAAYLTTLAQRSNSFPGIVLEAGIRDTSVPLTREERHHAILTMASQCESGSQRTLETLRPQHAALRGIRAYQIILKVWDPKEYAAAHGIAISGETTLQQLSDPRLLRHFKDRGINLLRLTGLFPRGIVGRKGGDNAPGSPFSIKSISVDPELGSLDDLKAFAAAAKPFGIELLSEFTPNQTSCDCEMVTKNPGLYIHTYSHPGDLYGWFATQDSHGTDVWIRNGGYRDVDTGEMVFWTDVVQLDLTNQQTVQWVVGEFLDFVEEAGIKFVRVDMAYMLLNKFFHNSWGELCSHAGRDGGREFLADLNSEIERRGTPIVHIAEAFRCYDELGHHFDGLYNICDGTSSSGFVHNALWDSIRFGSCQDIRSALVREAFLARTAEPTAFNFVGHHDRGPLDQLFSERRYGLMALSYLATEGAVCIPGGTEVGFSDPCLSDGKVVSFDRPVVIDFSGVSTSWGQFCDKLMQAHGKLMTQHELLRCAVLPAIPEAPDLIAVALLPKGSTRAAAVVVTNFGETHSNGSVVIASRYDIPPIKPDLAPISAGESSVGLFIRNAGSDGVFTWENCLLT